MTALDQRVHALYDQGICAVPKMPGTIKRPAVDWQRYQHELPTSQQFADWFHSGKYDGLGIICGAVSGNLEMFEFEARAVDDGTADTFFETAQALGYSFVAQILEGWSERSPSGGLHLHYRVIFGPVAGNTKLASRPGSSPSQVDVLIETHGEGGFVVIAPTPGTGHESGRPWVTERGGPSAMVTITAEQRDRLHELARTFDLTPSVEHAPVVELATRTVQVAGERPGDAYNRSTSWSTILQPLGWQSLYQRGEVGYWQRPGQPNAGSIGATTNALGTDRLKVFSTSTIFDTQTTYDKLGAYALLNHHGNLTEAVRSLSADGFGDDHDTDLASWLPLGTARQLAAAQETSDDDPSPFIDWPKFWQHDHASEDWIARPLLPAGRQVALFAPAKTGKSLLALDVAAALATGRPILGDQRVDQRVVLYLDYEMTEADLFERLDEMGYSEDDNAALSKYLKYWLLPSLPPFDTEQGGQAIVDLVKKTRAEVVIIDTTARAVEGDEDRADTYRNLYRHTGSRLKRLGCTVLRTDHAGKAEGAGQRGSSAKNDDVDVVFKVEKLADGIVKLKRTHSRIAWVPEQVMLTLVRDPLGHRLAAGDMHGYVEGTHEAVDQLAQLGVPATASRRAAAAAMKAAGQAVRARVLNDAVRFRKTEAKRLEDGEDVADMLSKVVPNHFSEVDQTGGTEPDDDETYQVANVQVNSQEVVHEPLCTTIPTDHETSSGERDTYVIRTTPTSEAIDPEDLV